MGGNSSSNGVSQPLMASTDADIYQNIAFPRSTSITGPLDEPNANNPLDPRTIYSVVEENGARASAKAPLG